MEEQEYFKVYLKKDTHRFFKIEYMREGAPYATYLFDDQCRITTQQKGDQNIHWLYETNKKTAEIRMNGVVIGRNIFEYQSDELVHILFFDQQNRLVRTIRLDAESTPDFFLQKEEEAGQDRKPSKTETEKPDVLKPKQKDFEEETDKRFLMEAEDMLELGN